VLKAPVGSVVAHGAEVPVSAPWSSVEEALEVGDSETATRLLDTVNEGLKDSPEYRRLRILTDAMAIDMLWWQRRILPKTETSQISSLTTTLTARLTALSGLLERCSADEDCSTKTISAKWALGRMQGQVALVQRPKHGTVDATGLYQLAMLDWVAADKPDSKTLDRLTKARLAGVEQGPRVTALIVALIDSKRFDDARAELAKLSTATKAHPHLEALNRYLRLADTVPTEDAGVPDVESDEGDANDPDLREPDFRIRLQRAAGCLSRSEVTKAQKLFRSVLAQRPNDIEALTGIADILRRRGNLAQARTQYDRVLALNGNYLPAMVGSAETRWKSGDRPGAVTTYRRIVELVGEGPGYGQQAAARIKEFEGVKSEPSPASDGNSTKGVTAPAADAPRKTP
jgi:tetratricopeptide (TPR) repeat protein